MRTVKHQYDQTQLGQLVGLTSPAEVHKALAYLSTWALDSARYAVAELWINLIDAPEMLAVYREVDGGNCTYTIGAVWHDDHFGFHS